MKSKKSLFKSLAILLDSPAITVAGLKHHKISNETYGKKSCVYVHLDNLNQRLRVERELIKVGFKVNREYWPESKTTEVEVSYFKGDNWDV